MSSQPLIERYRDRLSIDADDPIVSLGEGSTPLIEAPVISERLGTRVLLKLEGANPTGSFKDRGMTLAVSRAKGDGAEAVLCASTGNTAASAAAYAARAGMRGVVIVPEGKIAIGKLAQALMHGARVIALRGNFDQALEIVRALAERHPVELVNSINPYRIDGQKTAAFEVCDELGEPPDAIAIPVGNAGNVTAWWRGFKEYETAPVLWGFQAEGAAPLVARRAGGRAGDGRLGDPDRQPGPLGGGDGRLHLIARAGSRRSPTTRSSTPTGCSPRGKVSSASRPRPRRWPAFSPTAWRCPRAHRHRARSSACSPATGSRIRTRRSARRRRSPAARPSSRRSSAPSSADPSRGRSRSRRKSGTRDRCPG